MNYRRPIVSVLGHVDHGKTELLDAIRDSNVQNSEPGGITQHVKATNMSIDSVRNLTSGFSDEVNIPGFVWIDTPGHDAFKTARSKGGQFADIAVLVIDVKNGLQPQTIESIEILKRNQTPFVVALNKIDKLPGWNGSVSESTDVFRDRLRNRAYEISGSLHEHGITANLYDKIDDFQKNVAMIPISAKESFGVSELSRVVIGLTQRYLDDNITVSSDGSVEGVILNVTKHKGFGTVADILLYDGRIEEQDKLFISADDTVQDIRIKSILLPDSDGKDLYTQVDSASAAVFARLDIVPSDVLKPGYVIKNEPSFSDDETSDVETDEHGVVVCADTSSSMSALVNHLRDKDYQVGSASVGSVNRYNVTEASTMPTTENKVVIGFNVGVTDGAEELAKDESVRIVNGTVIHGVVEDYEDHHRAVNEERKPDHEVIRPGEMEVMDGFVFNRESPAIFGVRVTKGQVHQGCSIVRDVESYDNPCGTINRIEKDGETVEYLEEGEEGSVQVDGASVGKDFRERDRILSKVSESEISEVMSQHEDLLSDTDVELIEEIRDYHQKWNPFWGA